MRSKFFIDDINLYTIIEVLVVAVIVLFLKNFVVKVIIKAIKKICERYKMEKVSLMIDSIEKPLKTFFTYTILYCAIVILPFNMFITTFIYKVYRTIIIIIISQGLLNLVTAYQEIQSNMITSLEGKPPVLKTIIPLLSKCIKALIIIVAIVAIASEFDFKELNSILAGVGIGGVAVAFAAQDLLKNFFGGFVVLTDQSFNVGDFIKVNENEGNVEELGIRSTKIRTLEQELIVVPNSKFADGAVINYSKRNLRRVKIYVGATYDTPSDKLKKLVDNIKEMIGKHPKIKKDSIYVNFDKFSPSSLDIMIQYLIETSNYDEYVNVKEEINFNIMSVFEELNIEFAFQCMNIYMKKD